MAHEMDQWEKKLLYIYVIGKAPQFMRKKSETWEKIVFQNAGSNTIQTHFYSPDKDEYPHGYDNIQENERYVVESVKHPTLMDDVGGVSKSRWIWRNVIELPMHHFTNVYKFSKKHTHDETLLCAIGAYKNVRLPKEDVEGFEYDV